MLALSVRLQGLRGLSRAVPQACSAASSLVPPLFSRHRTLKIVWKKLVVLMSSTHTGDIFNLAVVTAGKHKAKWPPVWCGQGYFSRLLWSGMGLDPLPFPGQAADRALPPHRYLRMWAPAGSFLRHAFFTRWSLPERWWEEDAIYYWRHTEMWAKISRAKLYLKSSFICTLRTGLSRDMI